MTFLKAHYDGEHIVLDEDAALKPGQKMIVIFKDETVSEMRQSLLDALKTEHPLLTEAQRNEIADYAEFLAAQNQL